MVELAWPQAGQASHVVAPFAVRQTADRSGYGAGVLLERTMKLRWRREGLLLLTLVLLSSACAYVAYHQATELTLELGTPADTGYIQGFLDAETSPTFGFSFRWTGGQGRLVIPALGRSHPLLASMEVVGWLDSAGRPMTVTLSADQQVLGRFAVGPMSQERTKPYQFLFPIPTAPSLSGDLVIDLNSPTFSPPGDARQLGLLVNQVTILYGSAPGWPPLWPTLALVAIILLVYLAVRLAGWPPVVGGALAGILAVLLAVLLVYYRLWVAPYLPALAGMVAITAALLLLVRLLFREDELRLPQLVVAMAVLSPLLLWWQTLIIQTPGGGIAYLPASLPLLAAAIYGGVLLQQRLARERRIRWSPEVLLVTLVVACSLVYGVLFFREVFSKDYANDFRALFDGIRRFFLSGEQLYDLDAIRGNPFGDTYKYPPLFALTLWPLARVPFVPALQIWRVVQLLLLAASVWLLARTYRFDRNLWLWASLILVLMNFRPLGDTVAYGQVDIMLLLLIVGSWVALRQDHDWAAGLLLALAAMLKLYPAFLVLFFVARRRWRALLAFAVGLVALAGLSVLILGWPVNETYLREVLPISGGGTAWVENQTFNGFLNRLLTDRLALDPTTSRRADEAALLGAGILTAITGGLIYKFGKRESLNDGLGFSLLVVTMLLALPAAWIHYETILVLPFVLLFVSARERGTLPFRAVVLVALAFAFICFGNIWLVFQRDVYGRFWQLLLSYKVYGMLLLWLGLALLLIHRPRAAGIGREVKPTGSAD
jgi:hypothetical protein